ncbi:hypothetical protein PanWU01x14_024950 [Parasponia andersonii]|uniref:Uncharacterized protein n=1 Tax=Parasponia andersonii TaxID=3476 RepID=A0A2P5DWU7_PARAD|nr:hypothetical protein PanWU01x14_024950 [Parasponia andersonii]
MSPWSLHVVNSQETYCADFLKFILSIHADGTDPQLLLYASILIESIWTSKNQLLLEAKPFDQFRTALGNSKIPPFTP